MGSSDDDCCYIYLDFNEKLTSNIFANKMFLRVANLHKPNPLVQVNDLLFKGTFDECVGTNLFFEEVEDPPLKTNIFEQDTPIRLKPLVSQTKIIKLKQAKLPRKVTSTNQCKESVILNLNQDYHTVLEKLEQGMLNIDDIAHKEPEPTRDEQFDDFSFESPDEISTEPEKEIETLLEGIEDKSQTTELEAKYERLKRLARRPVKRMKSPELVEECDPEYRNAYEYHNLEKQICQSSDAFRSVSCPIIEKSFVGGVDIDRCVLQGLIPASSNLNRVLTKDEQSKIFAIDNFENLSLPARYLVLKEHVSRIEELIETTSTEELKETDENGRTITDICDIFRRLVKALEHAMAVSSDGEELTVVSRTDLSERPSDEYVKYKYNPAADLVQSEDIFSVDDWIDADEDVKRDEIDDSEDSMEDADEESDQN
ncbi:hypothetical protein GEV33_015477 [Tenebrio molitor]|uniref:Transcription factor TFIIIC triple barrel domain-containing protein n=1 Tax=Tenebrio molitor TaxID=7067 RepID=A0A8J6H384_TENMO|nr:hypothetical protein GEV33_015480 [Tenebrio molitor]KAH0807313.1 hypothetical protein GEV33_015477 [Tenebrio molitor]